MFQTPQQKAAGGIMAGVAPMYEGMGPMRLEDGGFLDDLRSTVMKIPGAETAVDVYDDIDFRGIPGRALEEIKNIDVSGIIDDTIDTEDFFTTDRTEEGSGMNLRDLTDLVFDPTDPFDLMTVPLVMFPPAFAAARLAKVGITGNKLSKQLGKIDTAKKLLGEGKDKTKSGIGNYFKLQVGQDLAEGAKEGYDYFTEPEGKAAGGIMSFGKGDYVSKGGFFEDLFSTGESLAKAGKRILGLGDDVAEEAVEKTVKRKGPKKGGGKKETKKEREEREKREREEAEKKEKEKSGDEEVGSGPVTDKGLFSKTIDFAKKPLVLGPTAAYVGSQFGGDSDSEGQVAELEAQVADLNKQLENAAKNDGTNSQAYKDALSKITAYEAKIKQLEDKEPPPNENLLTKALNKLRGAAGSAGSIDPSVLAGLINMGSSTDLFEPPKSDAQKFLEGRQGFRMQEAEIDKAEAAVRQADAADMLDVEKQFNLFKTRIEAATGTEMSQQDQAALLLNIQRDARDQKNLMSLFATAAPGMINEQAINEFRNQNTEKFVRDQLGIQ